MAKILPLEQRKNYTWSDLEINTAQSLASSPMYRTHFMSRVGRPNCDKIAAELNRLFYQEQLNQGIHVRKGSTVKHMLNSKRCYSFD